MIWFTFGKDPSGCLLWVDSRGCGQKQNTSWEVVAVGRRIEAGKTGFADRLDSK